jgi:hypothetical protein
VVAFIEPAKGWFIPSGVGGRPRSRGCRDGEAMGDESTNEDAVGEPPREEEGDMCVRSSGLIKAIFLQCVRIGVWGYECGRYMMEPVKVQ